MTRHVLSAWVKDDVGYSPSVVLRELNFRLDDFQGESHMIRLGMLPEQMANERHPPDYDGYLPPAQ